MSDFVVAIIVSALAGISTAIGGLIVLTRKNLSAKFISFALGFSAGVMIYISMTELLNSSHTFFAVEYTAKQSAVFVAMSFFCGMILMGIINQILPEKNQPHHPFTVNKMSINEDSGLLSSGILTAVAIAIHNFPEGLTTFSLSATNIQLALPILIAIAIHNIPEGIAVAAPIYKATGKRKPAFWWSAFSGISEPIGGLIGYLVLKPFLSDFLFGMMYGTVAGIMVYISIDELLPLSQRYDSAHSSLYGVVSGMLVMALSLILFM